MRKKLLSQRYGFIHSVLSKVRSFFEGEEPQHFSAEKNSMRGAGVRYKNKKYVTHTSLHHSSSALITFLPSQIVFMVTVVIICGIGLIFNFLLTIQIALGILSIVYFVDVLFNIFIITKSLHTSNEITFEVDDLQKLQEFNLPIYTILCPLFRESEVVPQFIDALEKIDWPKDKLDVLLLLEEDDLQTIDEIKHMRLPEYTRMIIVPHSEPKTKPKACNYGLSFAKGEYVVIYDAEDIPEPTQLKKAFYAFQRVSSDVKCLQAKLNYYNPHQNLLTRLFTAEYSLWFDVTLTGLQTLDTALPLGGTSNHFRTHDLMQLKGWDPFNVTEDADLGVRLFKQGYKTAIIDSTTLEEANSRLTNWVRQRSRWMKGYMQTYLVHNRDFWSFLKKFRVHALLFHINIGWKISFALINPVLWCVTLSYFIFRPIVGSAIEAIYPTPIFYMAAVSLAFGNFMFLYLYMVGCAKREQWELIKYSFFVPFYWIIWSFAGVIASYQLMLKPHYWEKTVHGFHISPTAGRAPAYVPLYEPGQIPFDPAILQPGVPVNLFSTILPSDNENLSTTMTKPGEHSPRVSSLFSSQLQLFGFVFAMLSVLLLFIDNAISQGSSTFSLTIAFVSIGLLFVYAFLAPVVHLGVFKKISKLVYVLPIMAFGLTSIHALITLQLHGISLFHVASVLIIECASLSLLLVLILQNRLNRQGIAIEGKKYGSKKQGFNILIFNWRDTKHVWAGGAEKYIQEIAKRWVAEGNKVTLFCSNDKHNKSTETIDGVQVIRSGGTFTVYFVALFYYLTRFRGKYDVVIDCENGIPFFTPLFVREPVFLLIFHVHQEVIRRHLWFPLSLILEFLESHAMPKMYARESVITISKSSKKDILRLGFNKTNSKIDIIYCGVDEFKMKKAQKTAYPSFMYLGRLKSYKKVDVAVRAFKEIVSVYPDARFTVAGYGESRRSLQKLARSLGVEKNIEFVGRISDSAKWKFYSQSWATLQPSQIEGWGITVIESNICRTPVIASNVSGLRDSVVNGKTGLLVHPGDVDDMAQAMMILIEDQEYREFLSQQSYYWAKNFSWDTSATSFMQLINNRLSNQRISVSQPNVLLNPAFK